MVKCIFCGKVFDTQSGGVTIFDAITGAARSYCSSKCRKNALMNRRKKKWAVVKDNKK